MDSIRWGSGCVSFELRSHSSQVLETAQAVFGRWPARDDAPVEGAWEVRADDGRFFIDPMPASPYGNPIPELTTSWQAVTLIEYAAIWRIVEQCQHILAFHAALLTRNGRSVAIVGPSEAGKSTLSTALWQDGWTFLCDDLTMVSGLRASPGPRRISLRDGSRALVGEDLWEGVTARRGYMKTTVGCLFHPAEFAETVQEVDLNAVIFLKRSGAPEVNEPSRLVPADAALALLPYTNLARVLAFPEALAPVAELMSVVPGWDLPRAPLPSMIKSVERIAGLRAP